MKKFLTLVGIGLILTTVSQTGQTAENKQEPARSSGKYSSTQLSVELLGHAQYYSVFGSFRFSENIAANLGLSYFTTPMANTSGTSTKLIQVPASVSYLFGEKDSFLELLGGIDAMMVSNAAPFGAYETSVKRMVFLPTVGGGYRYWPVDGGFSFRATVYGMISGGYLNPWVGTSFGYAFAP